MQNSQLKTNNSRLINAWAFYDWANSVYPLVITSTIFPIYFNSITSTENSDIITLFGHDFVNTALYSYALSFSFLIIALISPILSGIADYKGNKKSFMKFFCYLGAVSCSSMCFFDSSNLWLGLTSMILASIGFSGSLIFYNAYLPEITTPDNFDRVSAKGFSLGYIGSSLLLIFNLTMILYPEIYGITDDSFPARFSFVLVGVWWVGFAQITFKYLPEGSVEHELKENILSKGYGELKRVWNELVHQLNLKTYLFAFFFYNMGVQTVMYAAVLFGDKELKLESGQLITSILIIQFIAIGGAYLFSNLSDKFGNIKALTWSVLIWIGICIAAYFVYEANEFYMLAAMVGLVMGGIQSLSRSTYAKFLPKDREQNAYFSFFDITEKLAIVLGMFCFGLIEDITGDMRNSVIALTLFFVVGLILLLRVKVQDSMIEDLNIR
ncbi:MAG: MFS transporter [Bacteroidetes bacterium]|nr:MAG: MFS transporter [Bacteroidota bacterium]